ncbi:kinesin light chain 3, partial [Podospora australis]
LGLMKTVLGEEHPEALTSMNNLALVLNDQGKYEEAKQTQRQAFELRQRMLGSDHRSTHQSRVNKQFRDCSLCRSILPKS